MERYLKYSDIKDYQEYCKTALSGELDYGRGAARAVEDIMNFATYDPYAEMLVALLNLRGKFMEEPQRNKSIPIADALGILAEVVAAIRDGSQLDLNESPLAKI